MSIIIFIVCVMSIMILKTLYLVISQVMVTDQNRVQIAASKKAIKGTSIAVIITCGGCVIHIFTDTESMYDYLDINWDNTLANCVLHSLFLIMIGSLYMLMVFDFRTKKFFKIHRHSICGKCCKWRKKKRKKKKKGRNGKIKKRRTVNGGSTNAGSGDTSNEDKTEPLLRKTSTSVTGTIN